jgi:BlaI family transcriptional regulator, penicillinase repressor
MRSLDNYGITSTMKPVNTALPVCERMHMTVIVPTGRELEALKVLWTRGKATVREIYQEMKPRDGEGELAYTTVLSLLQTMEQKGLVAHESAGKAYVYCPLVQRENTFRKLAGGFLDQVFDGALGEYVARALQSRRPSLKELEELERMIGEAKKKARSANKSQ